MKGVILLPIMMILVMTGDVSIDAIVLIMRINVMVLILMIVIMVMIKT